jgi:hypothetical protein
VLERAEAYAKIPDVKALVDLRTRAAQPSGESAGQKEELARIDEYLIEAQRFQLAKDAEVFRKHQLEEYLGVLRRAAADIDEIGARLKSTAPSTGALSDLRAKSVQVASRLHAVPPPSQFESQHTAACAAADDAVAALAGASTGDPARATVPALEHTRSALRAAIAAASASRVD